MYLCLRNLITAEFNCSEGVYNCLCVLKLPVFYRFRKWKAFKVWRDNVRAKKVLNSRKSLEENLFFLNLVSAFDVLGAVCLTGGHADRILIFDLDLRLVL